MSLWSSFLGDLKFITTFSRPHDSGWWTSQGLTNLFHFQEGLWARLLPPLLIFEKHNLYNNVIFFHYLQIRHFFTTHYALSPLNFYTVSEGICHNQPCERELISTLYTTLSQESPSSKLSYMLFVKEEWDSMWTNFRKSVISLAIRDTAFKLCTRWYYTPLKLFRLSSSVGGVTDLFITNYSEIAMLHEAGLKGFGVI